MGPAALCIPCCPCDQRDTYIAPDGRRARRSCARRCTPQTNHRPTLGCARIVAHPSAVAHTAG
eukprot:1172303-Prymnesium_polylepis.1